MNTFNFSYYIRSNNALNEYTLKQLSQLIRHYPFFQMARMLYLKNLYVLHKEEFESELKKNVLHITDRKKLYELLFEQSFPTAEESNDNNNKPKEDSGASTTSSENITAAVESISTTGEIIASEQDDYDVHHDSPRLSHAVKRIFTESMRENISGLLDFQQHDAHKDTMEAELRLNTIQYDLEKEYGDQLEVINHNPPAIELDIKQDDENNKIKDVDLLRISNSVSSARGLLNLEYRLKKAEKTDDNTPAEELEIETELLELDAAVEEEETAESTISETTSSEEESGKSFTEWLDEFNGRNKNADLVYQLEEKAKGQEDVGLTKKGKSKNRLIERFIELNPTMKPTAKLEHEQYDISTESIEENEDYLTDTLAKIYVKQERYYKAISVYKKLILKYPEKNTYFANQINEIEKKLNN